MKLIHRYSLLKDVARLQHLTADFLYGREDTNGRHRKCNMLLRLLVWAFCCQAVGVSELTKSFFSLMPLNSWIVGWAANSVNPPPVPQPAQKPNSLNVNANKTPMKGDTVMYFFQLRCFSFSSVTRVSYQSSQLLCHNKIYLCSSYMSRTMCSLMNYSVSALTMCMICVCIW